MHIAAWRSVCVRIEALTCLRCLRRTQEHDLAIAVSQFKAALSERSDKYGLNLDDLGTDSPLGCMLLLEALRAKGGPLHVVRG